MKGVGTIVANLGVGVAEPHTLTGSTQFPQLSIIFVPPQTPAQSVVFPPPQTPSQSVVFPPPQTPAQS